ncbi:hypothetical protein CF327_g1757 [Tilletia walkeri]|nr:hypothetical protein CF327_g1757 [Tilletia walkeri]
MLFPSQGQGSTSSTSVRDVYNSSIGSRPRRRLDLSLTLRLKCLVHDLEKQGHLKMSESDAWVENFGGPRQSSPRHVVQQDRRRDTSSGSSTSQAASTGMQSFALRTSSEDLLLRMFDTPSSGDHRQKVEARLTASLMAFLRTEATSGRLASHGSPTGFEHTSTATRTYPWCRSPVQSISAVIPKVVTFYESPNGGLEAPWILFERPQGLVLDSVIDSASRQLQDRFQLAKALARLQAAIWGVQDVPGWGTLRIDEDSVKLCIVPEHPSSSSSSSSPSSAYFNQPSSRRSEAVSVLEAAAAQAEAQLQHMSLGSTCAPSAEESPIFSEWSVSTSIPHTRSSSYAYSCTRESPPTSPASSSRSQGEVQNGDASAHGDPSPSPLPPSSRGIDTCPLTASIMDGLHRQRSLSDTSIQGILHIARLDRIIEAAEVLLFEEDEDCKAQEHGNEDDFGRETDSNEDWERARRSAIERMEDRMAPKFVLSLPQLSAQNIFVDKVHMDHGSSHPIASRSSSSLPTPPAAHRGQRAAFHHFLPAPSPPAPSWTVTGLSEIDIARGEPAPLAFLSAMSSHSIWAQMLWERPVELASAASHSMDMAERSLKKQQKKQEQLQEKHSRQRKRQRRDRDGGPSSSSHFQATFQVKVPAHRLHHRCAPELSDDESDLGFEFDVEVNDDRKRKRAHPSRTSSSGSSSASSVGHPQSHHRGQEDQHDRNTTLLAFYSELARLVPSFDKVYQRSLASKLPELLRLAKVDGFGTDKASRMATATATATGGGQDGAEWTKDERVVLAAAAERRRRRLERAAAAASAKATAATTTSGGAGQAYIPSWIASHHHHH